MICRQLPFRRLLRLRGKCYVIATANFVCMFVFYSFLNETRQQKFERLGHIDPRTYYRVRLDLGPLLNKTVPGADTFDYGPCENLKVPPPFPLKETFQFQKVWSLLTLSRKSFNNLDNDILCIHLLSFSHLLCLWNFT